MTTRWLLMAVLVGLILLGSAGVALAQDSKLNSDAVGEEMTKFLGYAKVIGLGLLVVAILWAVAKALSTARENGGFTHVVATVGGILIAALVVWLVLQAFGDNPKDLTKAAPIETKK